MSERDILSEILQRMVRVETKIDNFTDVKVKAYNANKKAGEALEKSNSAQTTAKTAHKRIDRIDKAIFWLVTGVLGWVLVSSLSTIFTGGN